MVESVASSREGPPPNKYKKEPQSVLGALLQHQHGWVFNSSVDPVELGLPDYFEIIKKPMDFGSISEKLRLGEYRSLDHFYVDVSLEFDNAMPYNEPGTVAHDMAVEMTTLFFVS